MATKKEKAVAVAQKEFNKQLAATKALASKTTTEVNRLTTPKITTPDNTAFGLTDVGFDLAAKRDKDKTKVVTTVGKFRASDGREFDTAAERDAYQATLDAAAKDKYNKEQEAAKLAAEKEAEKRDAFALIEDTMRAYGFTASEMGELNTYIQNAIINPSLGPNGAILGMKQLKVYQQRFAGNETRVKAGQNALSEYDYLQQENAYSEYLKAYGVENLGSRETFATLIGNSVSGTEVQKRVSTAVDRVKNSDPQIMAQLKTYYPTLTDNDLVSYFLNPKQALPDLQRKVTASEIGAAAVGQGFKGATDALGLADYGVDRATALEGYSNIAGVLPEATKLGDIYGETGVKYTQQSGEEEFLKQNEAAKRKRNILASKERASFEGSAGNAPGAYSTSHLRKSSSSGLI
jgi:hypothetical protein